MVSRRIRFAVWWRHSGMWLRLFLFLVGFGLFALLLSWHRPDEESVTVGQNVLIFALVNLNIAVLCVLVFLIGRNITKLVFDRKRRLLGSKLRTRLMVVFVGLTLVPSTFVFIMASGFLTRSVEGWFNSQVETSISSAVKVAQLHFTHLKEDVLRAGVGIARNLRGRQNLLKNRTNLERYLEKLRKETGLYGINILKEGKIQIAEAHNANAYVETFQEPVPVTEAISRALRRGSTIRFEDRGANQFVRAYLRILRQGKPYIIVATLRVEPELSAAIAAVTDSYREYEQLKLFRNPLASGYTLTLAMITGLVIFGAIWIAFYIARQIVIPIQKLAEGTRAIARGDYEFQIRNPGDDEFGFLVNSFNLMVSDLKHSRAEAEKRRLFIETILSNLAVGVIGIDPDRNITSINKVACRLFGQMHRVDAVGKPLSGIMAAEHLKEIEVLLQDQSDRTGDDIGALSEVELYMMLEEKEHRVLCTTGVMRSRDNAILGTLLLFDDITDLARAQAMSAWREVAQRIAHEIRNPLTPIQLYSQRLKKLIPDIPGRSDLVESAETIVENVEIITRLANEFSKFARMPTAEMRLANLNNVITDTVATFAATSDDIVFQVIADTNVPEILMDPGQIRGVLVNLIDNAIAAIHSEQHRPEGSERPKIIVRSSYDRKEKKVEVEVSDNGPGIPASDKYRIFEPYFTTKKKGTGLGLAIVTTVVADHQGEIRVFDSTPRGTRFIVVLPAARRQVTQRRLAEV